MTTQSRPPFPIAPNILARQFERAGPDQAWVTDITYIPTGEGWLYLAVILDLCSRFAVGWAMSERITDDFTLDALGMALARQRPPPGLLHHSDRGSQYASGDYQKVLAENGIVCSISRRGNCWDNAVVESFFATLKVELVHDATWATRALARTALFDYLELFYNGQRRHAALGYLSPRAFERQRAHDALATVYQTGASPPARYPADAVFVSPAGIRCGLPARLRGAGDHTPRLGRRRDTREPESRSAHEGVFPSRGTLA